MPAKVFCKRDEATKHKVTDHLATAKTLAKIVEMYQAKAAEGYELTDWKELALYNWGTEQPAEVNRALMELIGCGKVDDTDPSQTELIPDSDLPGEILIPKIFKKEGLNLKKRHVVTLKKQSPATAVRLKELDPWFIPDLEGEECVIKFALEGAKDRAKIFHMDIYGSNYCECTSWEKGLGKYEDPSKLVDEPIFKHADSNISKWEDDFKWPGDVTSEKGMLSRKTGKAKKRYINAAFSPYTVHFRYYKAGEDKDARLILDPFWPQWEEDKTEPTVQPDWSGGSAKFKWSNAKDQDYGAIEITDKEGQRVHHAVLKDEKLTKEPAEQEVTWDKKYIKKVYNGKLKEEYIDDSGIDAKELLFKSTPYKAVIRTRKRKPKEDDFKIKWEIKKAANLARGLIEIVDKDNKVVFRKGLTKSQVEEKKHELAWDGKYMKGAKNSKAKATDAADKEYVAIAEDMPYRVRIEVHRGENEESGLAIAAMQTEVRFYTHKENYAPDDIRFESSKVKPSISLGVAKMIAGDAPKKADGTKWARYQLAAQGFHPGPITDDSAADAEYHLALREFKRSVPKHKTGAHFERQTVDTSDSDGSTTAAIENLEPRFKRNWFGKLSQILANNNAPDYTYPSDSDTDQKTINERFSNSESAEELVLWIDDRQYYTKNWIGAVDENNTSYEQPPFNMNDYRGSYNTGLGEHRAIKDEESIARPWIPLEVRPVLLSRTEKLDAVIDIKTLSDKRKKAMQKAIGPLRVDWNFEDLTPDFSTLTDATSAKDHVRTRRHIAWTKMVKEAESHTRKDTKRATKFWNCPKSRGGIRPTSLASYYEKLFSHGDLSLTPWRAIPDPKTESVATVIHDHIVKDQKTKEKGPPQELFEKEIGSARIFFHPSIVAGDGYRIRAQMQFDKVGDYELKNAEVLKKRYPVPPQSHSSPIRLWRRSSIRGYMRWGEPAGNWPAFINTQIRPHYRMAHVYFIPEGQTTLVEYPLTDVFDPAVTEHKDRYKNIVEKNVDAAQRGKTIKLKSDYVWPWSEDDNYGWDQWSPPGINGTEINDWLRTTVQGKTWHKFSSALLFGVIQALEKKTGLMKGPIFLEFKSSGTPKLDYFNCSNGHAAHRKLRIRKPGATVHANVPCSCGGTLTHVGAADWPDKLPWDALGLALGATWLFKESAAAADERGVWAHEVGHQRHFEHAASAPISSNAAARDGQHDSTPNGTGVALAGAAEDKRWDRRCVMTYTYDEKLYFCGKCILRHSGWKVESLGNPPGDHAELV